MLIGIAKLNVFWQVHFEPALRKMAEYLVNLELEHQYLSSEKNNEELAHIFGKVFDGLNSERKHAEVVVRNYRIQVSYSFHDYPTQVYFMTLFAVHTAQCLTTP